MSGDKKGFGTTMGGGSGKFRTTCWSMVLHAADPNSPKHAAHLEGLIERYWKPVYVTIRLGWHKTNDDAKDHTQSVPWIDPQIEPEVHPEMIIRLTHRLTQKLIHNLPICGSTD